MQQTQRMTERDLVAEFKSAYANKKAAEKALEDAEEKFDKAESAILELLEATGAETTARYEGLGYVRQMEPKLYASYAKENEEQVFRFAKSQKRDDIIKEMIHPGTLSSFVKELIEQGREIPEVISYYFKKKARLFGAK
jgi:hypothetical protein